MHKLIFRVIVLLVPDPQSGERNQIGSDRDTPFRSFSMFEGVGQCSIQSQSRIQQDMMTDASTYLACIHHLMAGPR